MNKRKLIGSLPLSIIGFWLFGRIFMLTDMRLVLQAFVSPWYVYCWLSYGDWPFDTSIFTLMNETDGLNLAVASIAMFLGMASVFYASTIIILAIIGLIIWMIGES
jgi:hypothetical protein